MSAMPELLETPRLMLRPVAQAHAAGFCCGVVIDGRGRGTSSSIQHRRDSTRRTR